MMLVSLPFYGINREIAHREWTGKLMFLMEHSAML
jgi:hypothetical protein